MIDTSRSLLLCAGLADRDVTSDESLIVWARQKVSVRRTTYEEEKFDFDFRGRWWPVFLRHSNAISGACGQINRRRMRRDAAKAVTRCWNECVLLALCAIARTTHFEVMFMWPLENGHNMNGGAHADFFEKINFTILWNKTKNEKKKNNRTRHTSSCVRCFCVFIHQSYLYSSGGLLFLFCSRYSLAVGQPREYELCVSVSSADARSCHCFIVLNVIIVCALECTCDPLQKITNKNCINVDGDETIQNRRYMRPFCHISLQRTSHSAYKHSNMRIFVVQLVRTPLHII